MKSLLTFREFISIKKAISLLTLRYEREKNSVKKARFESKIIELHNKLMMSGNFEHLFKMPSK